MSLNLPTDRQADHTGHDRRMCAAVPTWSAGRCDNDEL